MKGQWVAVIVRHGDGRRYRCRLEPPAGWRCGRCEVGVLPRWPRIGSLCPVCRAEVVAVRRHLVRLAWAVVFAGLVGILLWTLAR